MLKDVSAKRRLASVPHDCVTTTQSSQRGYNRGTGRIKWRLAWAVLVVCIVLPVTSVTAVYKKGEIHGWFGHKGRKIRCWSVCLPRETSLP